MKKLVIMFMLSIGLVFLTGCTDSDNNTENTLIQALKSQEADRLAGDEGVYIIFVQSRDSIAKTDVEALNALYFLSAIGIDQMNIYETDKSINILDEELVNDTWLETRKYHPANLSDIDFQEAYRAVKVVSGDKPIANVAIFYTLEHDELRVGFTLQGDATDSCEQYAYIVDTGEVYQTGSEVKCFYDSSQHETHLLTYFIF